MKSILLTCLFSVLILSNCFAYFMGDSEESQSQRRGFNEQEKKACLAKGGHYLLSGGRAGKMTCSMPTADNGKECTSGNQCELKSCLADFNAHMNNEVQKSGKCWGYPGITPDCWATMENGVVIRANCQ